MGKPTGFKEFSREVEPYRPSKERLLDFKEIYTDHKEDGLKTQASGSLSFESIFFVVGIDFLKI